MKKQTVFLSDDGKTFTSKAECVSHEKNLLVLKQRKQISERVMKWLSSLPDFDEGLPFTSKELEVIDSVVIYILQNPKKFLSAVDVSKKTKTKKSSKQQTKKTDGPTPTPRA